MSYKDSTCKPVPSNFIRRGKAHQERRTKTDGTEPDRLDKSNKGNRRVVPQYGDFHHEEYNLATNST